MRFSLRTLLLLVTIVALATSLIVTSRKLNETQTQLRKANDELGQLTIDEPGNLNVISIPSFEPMQWRWRVWLPRGKQFRLRHAFDGIPESGVQQDLQSGGSSGANLSAF